MGVLHKPVLLEECIEGLKIRPDGIYVDGTLGRAGHAREIAKRLGKNGRLIGLDRDRSAIEAGSRELAPFLDRITLVHARFSEIKRIAKELNISGVDGMLFDLGVSSPQLDETERGFSYMSDAPLDMRMDNSASLDAYEIVNHWPQNEIKRILYEYGEERYAPQIARAIAKRRNEQPIKTTLALTEIIKSVMPAPALREKQHPAKRSFQAIRIAVNDELGEVSQMLEDAPQLIKSKGRLLVISFHSLEDRLVKNAIQRREKGCICPPALPVCACGFVQTMKSVVRKPITPSETELQENPRSRSAKLRIAEKL